MKPLLDLTSFVRNACRSMRNIILPKNIYNLMTESATLNGNLKNRKVAEQFKKIKTHKFDTKKGSYLNFTCILYTWHILTMSM